MYHYVDAERLVALGPTVRAWRGLRLTLLTLGTAQAREFAHTGVTDNPAALAVELDALDGPEERRLRTAAEQARGTLVLTNGVGVPQERLR